MIDWLHVDETQSAYAAVLLAVGSALILPLLLSPNSTVPRILLFAIGIGRSLR